MKINGVRVTVYRDTKGPFDAYYQHGGIVSYISEKYKVTKAFDYMGEHIGIPKRTFHLGRKLVILFIPVIAALIWAVLRLCTLSTANCVIYRWHAPYINEEGNVSLDIKNISPSDLYINVGNMTYTLHQGDTLNSVPLFAQEFSIKFTYEKCSYTEEVKL